MFMASYTTGNHISPTTLPCPARTRLSHDPWLVREQPGLREEENLSHSDMFKLYTNVYSDLSGRMSQQRGIHALKLPRIDCHRRHMRGTEMCEEEI